jgi:hypothetical protein
LLQLDKLALQVKKIARAELPEPAEDQGFAIGVSSYPSREGRVTVARIPKPCTIQV